MSRTIPKAIREKLRREVNFGCPVEGCGNSYLSYHHFDPPWHEGKIHDPKGMIALCLDHHKQADYGTFTNDQLYHLKKTPYRKKGEHVKGTILRKRENFIYLIGGNIYISPQKILLMKDVPLVWLSNDSTGNVLLNFDVRSRTNEVLFSMRDNDWIISTNLDNIETIPSAKSIYASDKNHGVKIDIRFDELSHLDFDFKYSGKFDPRWIDIVKNHCKNTPIPICSINGEFNFPYRAVMTEERTTIYGEGVNGIKVNGSNGFTLNNVKEYITQGCLSIGGTPEILG